MTDILRSERVLTKQKRIAELAKQNLKQGLTSLNQFIDIEWMQEAWRLTRKDGACGIDEMSAHEFEMELGTNLEILLCEAKSGNYRAPNIKRVHIPKGNGETRPIGITTIGDKVLQRAVVMLLEPIYEQTFTESSFGFRKNRNTHQACEKLKEAIWEFYGGSVLEVDIKSYFDSIDRNFLREFLRKRITDGVILRLIDKWLNAGIVERGVLLYQDTGTAQGGVISPMLSNIYLHYVLDEWFETEVQKRLMSESRLIRFCDDFCIYFQIKADAERVRQVLEKRLAKFGLTIHPDKTRIINFHKPAKSSTKVDKKKSQTFDFLGFTFYWGMNRQGKWMIKLKTARKKFKKSLANFSKWCREHRHEKVGWQLERVAAKLRGHKNYFGVKGNLGMVSSFQYFALEIWKKWLSRRSSKAYIPWEIMHAIIKNHPFFRTQRTQKLVSESNI